MHGSTRQQHASLARDAIQRLGGLILSILETMGLVAYQQVAAILILHQTPDVRSDSLVASNENVEHLSLDEAIDVLLDGLAVRLCQC